MIFYFEVFLNTFILGQVEHIRFRENNTYIFCDVTAVAFATIVGYTVRFSLFLFLSPVESQKREETYTENM